MQQQTSDRTAPSKKVCIRARHHTFHGPGPNAPGIRPMCRAPKQCSGFWQSLQRRCMERCSVRKTIELKKCPGNCRRGLSWLFKVGGAMTGTREAIRGASQFPCPLGAKVPIPLCAHPFYSRRRHSRRNTKATHGLLYIYIFVMPDQIRCVVSPPLYTHSGFVL